MNARQIKKRLKKEIWALKIDNDLMRDIISNSPQMRELYDKYNRPLNVTHTTMHFQEYRASKILPIDSPLNDRIVALYKDELARELFEGVKDYITYKLGTEGDFRIISTSIFVGRK